MISILNCNRNANDIFNGITGFIIAADVQDARRQIHKLMDLQPALIELANYFYNLYEPPPGKTVLPTGHIMLVTQRNWIKFERKKEVAIYLEIVKIKMGRKATKIIRK